MSGWASAITAAIGSMTPAQQVLFRPSAGSKSGGTRRRKRRKTAAKTTRRKGKKKAAARRARGKASRFVKGSAAAKRHMAKLRRMRRRK